MADPPIDELGRTARLKMHSVSLSLVDLAFDIVLRRSISREAVI